MTHNDRLSKREREVLALLLEGKSNKQMALSLGISESTVEFHLKNIYKKEAVSSRTELILKLGKSTVADRQEPAENRDKPNLWMNWAASLRKAVSTIGKEKEMSSFENSDARARGDTPTFAEAIRICLVNYAEFRGRASRAEFWWFALFVTLTATALSYIGDAVTSIFLIVILLPLLAAGARRLHDTGRSGWWQLYLLVPVAGLVLAGILWALPPASSPADESH